MRVLLVSHTYLPSHYRGKLRWLASQPNVELTVLALPHLRLPTGTELHFEMRPEPFALRFDVPLAFSNNNSLRLYNPDKLYRLLQEVQPDIVHAEAEPHSLVLASLAWFKAYYGYKLLAFSWENIYRRGRWPLSQLEWPVLRRIDWMLAGNQDAAAVLRWRGYCGPFSVVPQVGVDLNHLAVAQPPPSNYQADDGLRVGFIGRLVNEKGVLDLVEAFAPLAHQATLVLIGAGPLQTTIMRRGAELGISSRIRLTGHVAYRDMPGYLQGLDMLVLPSRTTPHWKEQFGHVLPEAMLSGIPVIGSASGAIPEVIGEAGLLFPEGDISALRTRLQQLIDSPDLRRQLGAFGRQRAQSEYSDEAIARATLAVYHQMLEQI